MRLSFAVALLLMICTQRACLAMTFIPIRNVDTERDAITNGFIVMMVCGAIAGARDFFTSEK